MRTKTAKNKGKRGESRGQENEPITARTTGQAWRNKHDVISCHRNKQTLIMILLYISISIYMCTYIQPRKLKAVEYNTKLVSIPPLRITTTRNPKTQQHTRRFFNKTSTCLDWCCADSLSSTTTSINLGSVHVLEGAHPAVLSKAHMPRFFQRRTSRETRVNLYQYVLGSPGKKKYLCSISQFPLSGSCPCWADASCTASPLAEPSMPSKPSRASMSVALIVFITSLMGRATQETRGKRQETRQTNKQRQAKPRQRQRQARRDRHTSCFP